MTPHVRPPVADLPDAELLQRLHRLVAQDCQLTADLLVHLAEVDKRRLYRQAACNSMFTYCLEVLHFSESVACRRIAAARAARLYPRIFDLVATGQLHLSAVCVVAPHLDEDNHAELLAAVVHKSKREAEEIVAARFPKPDAAAFVRRVPSPPGAAIAPTLSLVAAATGAPLAPAATCASAAVPPAMPAGPEQLPLQAQPQVVSPLSADRFRIQFTASRALRDKLKAAQDLLRHASPRGDLEVVFERALDALLRELRGRKFGESSSPRAARAASDGAPKASDGPRPVADADARKRKRRPIPRATRRVVSARDEHRCAYVDPATGRRCSATAHLRFHHRRPWGLGGGDEAENLELRCAAHDGLAAEEDYGPAFVARKIAEARAERSLAGAVSGATVPGGDAPAATS